MTAKELVRQQFSKLRKLHALSDKASADQALHFNLQKLIADLAPSGHVLAYRPLPDEADPFLGKCDSKYAYPRVSGDDLEFFQVKSDADFQSSKWGVHEPLPEKATPVAIADISTVLIPGLAFDCQGHRLGFGKGFYDRFLKKCSPHVERVGIGYSFQVSAPALPREEWDEYVDWIVTDKFVLHVEGRGS